MKELIDSFLDYLTVERGLAKNTTVAYRRDLNIYLDFIIGLGRNALSQISKNDITDFMLFPAGELIITEQRRERAVRNIRRRSNELELPRTTKEKLAETVASGLAVSTNPLFYPLFYSSLSTKDSGPEGMGTLFDYLPPGGLLVLDDPFTVAILQEKIENDLDAFFLKAKNQKQFYPRRLRNKRL